MMNGDNDNIKVSRKCDGQCVSLGEEEKKTLASSLRLNKQRSVHLGKSSRLWSDHWMDTWWNISSIIRNDESDDEDDHYQE